MRVMRASQSGVSLSGLIIWAFVIAIVAVLGMKVVPDVIEYWQVKEAIASISHDPKLSGITDVRNEFDRYANINSISSVQGKDLEITKEGTGFNVSVAYEKRIKMFGPVSLVIDFDTSTAAQ
jgi:Domain of unknown function (DUF4845)